MCRARAKAMGRRLGKTIFLLSIAALAAGGLVPGAPARARDIEAGLAELLAADEMSSAQMAAALLRAVEGEDFTPPACVPGEEMFDDVPASNIFCPAIEELARRGITSGCDSDNFCPAAPVSRAQMASFIVKVLESNVPHAAGSSLLEVVPVTAPNFVVVQSIDIHAPVDGFLLVNASANVYCRVSGDARAEAGLDVDGTVLLRGYFFDAPDCSAGIGDVSTNVGMTKLVPVAAGDHTVNLMGRRPEGTAQVFFDGISITALFVRDGSLGAPSLATNESLGSGRRGVQR